MLRPIDFEPLMESQISQRNKTTKKTSNFKMGCVLLAVMAFLFLIFKVILPLKKAGEDLSLNPATIFSLLFNKGALKQDSGRINFLVMGIGGASHDGPDLTDSIMFVSLNAKTGESTIISLPRDIWIDKLNEKVNTAYAIGENRGQGQGIPLARSTISEIVGEPIHYVLVVNFAAFKEMIDLVGGVDVQVERTFDDYKYPKEDLKYEAATGSGEIYDHIYFARGVTHMDGKTALQFARSRYSEDPLEGTDFARSKRQQKIMVALKDKILSLNTLSDIPKLQELFQAFQKNIDTDIIQKDLAPLARLALKFDQNKMKTVVLDEGTDEKPGFLENPPVEEYGAWVLTPRGKSWQPFQEYLQKELEK